MTKAEFEAGAISPTRLAEIKKITGRWIDLTGTESVAGATPEGKAYTKFRQWAVPPLSSIADDITSLAKQVKTKGKKKVNAQQAAEFYRIAEVLAVTYLIISLAGESDDDSFTGKLKKYAVRELSTIVQAIDPQRWLDAGVFIGFLEQFGKNLNLLMRLEEYETNSRWGQKGELKGVKGFQRMITPNFLTQFLSEPKKESKGLTRK